MKTIFKVLAVALIGLCIVFFVGPRPEFEKIDNLPSTVQYELGQLDKMIAKQEAAVQYLKDDNEARIVWADSIPSKTPFSIVYLHGFSASQGEGYPLHLNIGDSLDANLYLPRLPEHGLDSKNSMKTLTPGDLIEEAKEAIAIGKTIGDKVILVGCSTGGTLALYLAAEDPDLAGLVLLSPNIEVAFPGVSLLTGPWGKQIGLALLGEHRIVDSSVNYEPYWSKHYHLNGLIAMQALLDMTMKEEIFEKIKMPTYCGYFYKNEEIQDPVVSVAAIKQLESQISTPDDDKEFEAFASGDHVLGSVYKNSDWQDVQAEVLDFINNEIIK